MSEQRQSSADSAEKDFGGGWSYRVIRFTTNTVAGEWFEVREVYYNSRGEHIAYTEGASGAGGDTIEELRADHAMIAEAFTRPVLEVSDFPVPESV